MATCWLASQGTCAFEAQNVVKLLTFDQVEKNKAAGQAATELSARLADLIKDYVGKSTISLHRIHLREPFYACK